MAKYLVLVLVAFTSIEYAVGLECYTSDLSKGLSSGDFQPQQPQLQDCHRYIANLFARQGIHRTLSPVDYSCFTVELTKNSMDREVQGCIPRNTCGQLVEAIKNLGQSGRVQCRECSGHGCNAPTT